MPDNLWVRRASGPARHCSAAACQGRIIGLWWSPDGREVRFLRRSGWANSLFSLYRWQPGSGTPRLILTTPDVLSNCQPIDMQLLCARDASTEPRRIIRLDPRTGHMETLYDPNPEFAQLRVGEVRRLHWQTDLGMPVFGDLVLPVGYRTGTPVPLIIVQYRTKGFLRGGTGDEYPIQAFAARGYAVLSIERSDYPASWAAAPNDPRTDLQLTRADIETWGDRRNNLSEVVEGLHLVERLGIADPNRIGITGMSDGAMGAIFALINGPTFQAAALSTCCMDPPIDQWVGGPGWTRHLQDEGYAPPDASAFWKPATLSVHGTRLRTPILMQLSDDEYESALQPYAALRDAHIPFELRVFPDEHHVKFRPAHRLAIYQRNLAWFDFWLRNQETNDVPRAEIENWRRMREEAARSALPSGPPLGTKAPD